ncbi:MAG: Xaa-Pro peptidase family protein [Trueperaceae bacterium]
MTPGNPIRPIERSERASRCERLHRLLPEDVRAIVLFDDQYVQYFTGFVFAATERPIGAVLLPDGERILFVPRLEREHAQATSDADRVVDYPEYPGERHPMERLHEVLADAGADRGVVGVDHDGYPPVMGYLPKPLSERWTVRSVTREVEARMRIKSEHEIVLIREASRWAGVAHRRMQDATRPGLREEEAAGPASQVTSRELAAAMGTGYRRRNRWISGALALYRGQIGPASAFPHALADDVRFGEGDVLVTGASADVWGYLSELERTMVLGEPDAERRRWFDHMLAVQDLAFEAIRPGTPCSEVDRAVQGYVDRHGLREHWRHHVGHGLGQRIHESPFLDVGDDTVLEPEMVLSVEPGLYVPGLGGFRHSDTVRVTQDGIEMLTDYPRDLASLSLPVD